jgi:DNA-binding protein HU-beta
MSWHLYLIECTDGSLYAGITTDVERRFREHLSGKGARYTRSHKPLCLVASRQFGSRSEALKAELAIKRLPKEKKMAVLMSSVPLGMPEMASGGSRHRSPNSRSQSMNKSELIEVVAKEAEISKTAAGNAVASITGAIVKAIAKGDTVALIGFGTFKSSKRAARIGRNPQTGKEIKIAATTVPRFTAGATFKAAVAGKKAGHKK